MISTTSCTLAMVSASGSSCGSAHCTLHDDLQMTPRLADRLITLTYIHKFNDPFSRTTRVSQYQKGKPIWILLQQETVSGNGISWAISESAPRSRQIPMPALHHSSFLQAGCPSCRPTNSVKALTNNYS